VHINIFRFNINAASNAWQSQSKSFDVVSTAFAVSAARIHTFGIIVNVVSFNGAYRLQTFYEQMTVRSRSFARSLVRFTVHSTGYVLLTQL